MKNYFKISKIKNLLIVISILSIFSIFGFACEESEVKEEQFELLTKEDSINYSLGVNIASKIKEEGATNINADIIITAIKQVYISEDSLLIDNEQATTILQNYFGTLHKNNSKKNKVDGKTFLSENKSKPGVVTLDNGLQYKILKRGKGFIPDTNDMVSIHFVGKFTDQTVFDNTYDVNPITFPINKSIKAWQQVLVKMPIGSKWEIYVKPELAYGNKGSGAIIKPNTVLIYQLELLEIKTPH